MKTFLSFILLMISACWSFGQFDLLTVKKAIGVKTNAPKAELHVKGNAIIETNLTVRGLSTVESNLNVNGAATFLGLLQGNTAGFDTLTITNYLFIGTLQVNQLVDLGAIAQMGLTGSNVFLAPSNWFAGDVTVGGTVSGTLALPSYVLTNNDTRAITLANSLSITGATSFLGVGTNENITSDGTTNFALFMGTNRSYVSISESGPSQITLKVGGNEGNLGEAIMRVNEDGSSFVSSGYLLTDTIADNSADALNDIDVGNHIFLDSGGNMPYWYVQGQVVSTNADANCTNYLLNIGMDYAPGAPGELLVWNAASNAYVGQITSWCVGYVGTPPRWQVNPETNYNAGAFATNSLSVIDSTWFDGNSGAPIVGRFSYANYFDDLVVGPPSRKLIISSAGMSYVGTNTSSYFSGDGNGLTNLNTTAIPTYLTNKVLVGSVGGTNWTFTDAIGWHNTNANGGHADIQQGNISFSGTLNGAGWSNVMVAAAVTTNQLTNLVANLGGSTHRVAYADINLGNTSFGPGAMETSLTNATARGMTAFGASALGKFSNAAIENTAVGRLALSECNDGSYNVSIGTQAGEFLIDGSKNTFVGDRSGNQSTNAYFSTFVGFCSGLLSQGDNVVGIGAYALYDDVTRTGPAGTNTYGGYSVRDSNVCAIGFCAGRNPSVTNTTSLTNSVALGNNSKFTTNNEVRLGNDLTRWVTTSGTVIATNGFYNTHYSTNDNMSVVTNKLIYCVNGTNQLITLFDASLNPWVIYRFVSTNGNGNFIITNSASDNASIRNGIDHTLKQIGVGEVGLFSDGANWQLASKSRTVWPNAQFSCTTNIALNTSARAIPFNTTDFNNSQGIALLVGTNATWGHTSIWITNAGQYEFSPSIMQTYDGNHTITFWFKLNGGNIANSATASKGQNGSIRVITVPFIVSVTNTSQFEIWAISDDATGESFVAQAAGGAAPNDFPAAPSVICPIKRISDSRP